MRAFLPALPRRGAEEGALAVGLSDGQLAMAAMIVVLALICLLVFVLLALTAWHVESGFDAAVQSAVIAACGRALPGVARAVARGNKAAQTGADLDAAVALIMKSQEEYSSGD